MSADIGSGDSSTSEATMVFPDLSSLASSETTTVTSHADTGARPKIPAQRQTVEEVSRNIYFKRNFLKS